jgi:hypothetical protein
MHSGSGMIACLGRSIENAALDVCLKENIVAVLKTFIREQLECVIKIETKKEKT